VAVLSPPAAPVLPTADATTEELLTRAGVGDRYAFSELYNRLMPTVLGVATRVLRDRALAEEVAQEVMVEVWAKADRFATDRGSAAAWVSTFAHRRAIDRVRSEQAARDRVQRVASRDLERPFDVVAEQVELSFEHWQVRQALAALSDAQREALELAYFAGHTYRDVAAVLGIPEGTAKSRLRDGLTRLRVVLEEAAEGGRRALA
jgi:RNA polymerase sigma-70 factor (ECF subfamily)